MNLRDIDSAVQDAIDSAFAAGQWRGKQQADADVIAECIELRVKLAERETRNAVVMHAFVAFTVIACWSILAAAVVWVA